MLTRTATTVWLDGTLLEGDELRLHAMTHALHYGTSVFEGIRVYPTAHGRAAFRLRDHAERLIAGAHAYGMRLAFDADAICAAVSETVRASGLDAAYVRPLAFFGGDGIRLNPALYAPTHLLVAAFAFDGILPSADGVPLFRAAITGVMKTPSKALPSTVKAGGHYTNSVRALADVQARGFDEAILLNDRGEVAEGSGENIFVVRDGTVVTNDESADILLGITRASALELARAAGIPTQIRPLTTADLLSADEAFFTGTAAELVPIGRIDERDFGAEGPVTARLRTAYTEIVRGRAASPAGWVTPL